MSSNRIYFKAFLRSAFDKGAYTTDDVIAFVLPLFREVCGLHEAGLVAPFGKDEALFLTEQALDIDEQQAHAPSYALRRVLALFPGVQSGNFEVVGKIKLRADAGEDSIEQENLQVHMDFGQPLAYPAYIPGYRCFEQLTGHHDPQTDIFCLGLILGSMALGLDLYDPDDLVTFARVRTSPAQYNDRLHPTVARLITEMTELDRSRRTQDLYDVIEHLEHYRDYDPEKQTDLSRVAGWINKELKQRDAFILNKLRNRLFDTSRRNRLLYYKPNMRFVNLTVSSVPVVLHYQSIRPEHLFTWNEELAEKFRGMKEIVLNKYLRFDDHAYLPSSLDRVRVESQRAIQEYGFNQLKLVIAFLNWHNLKEDPDERIQSPLLLLPVSLKKNKKLKEDHYVLKVLDNAAEVNPVLAGQLKDLYGIRLPDLVDLDETDPAQFYQSVKAQIDEANQGIVLNYISKPRIRLIHGEARQTVNNYRKRLRRQPGLSSRHHIPYSYKPEHYQPLGLEIFRQRIGTEKGFLAFLVQGDGQRSPPKRLMESADMVVRDSPVREAELYKLTESENNPYSWDFDVCHMVLGNFNYKKMSLVRDYNMVIDQQLQHPVFDALFSEQPRTFKEHPFDLNRTDDWHHVIQADPTQTRAILQSRAGYSYIIQGPPGTGKSQTITNLIADYVARGKSILFVCEKRAALDVVYHRLKQNGLDELCCYIHDSQGDKREFIRNLRSTYEDFTARRMDLPGLRAQRAAVIGRMNRQVDLLKEFHVTSTSGEQEIGIIVRKLIERIIELRQDLVTLSALEEEALPAYAAWRDAGGVIRQLSEALEEAGSDPIFAGHPFSNVHERIFLAEHPHRMLDTALGQALDLLDLVERGLAGAPIAREQMAHPAKLKSLVQFAVLLQPLVLTDNFRLADPSGEETRTFIRRFNEYKSQQETYQEALRKNIHWKEKLFEQDLSQALELAVKQEKALLNFLNGGWQKLKKQLQACYDFSAHAVKPSYRSILEHLRDEYEQAHLLEQVKRRLQEDYRLDNPDTAWLGISVLHQKKDDPSLVYLLRHPEAGAVVASLHSLHQPLVDLESRLKECLHPGAAESLEALRDTLQNIRLNADGLREMLPALRSFTELPEGVKNMLRGSMLSPRQAEAVIARKTLQTVYQTNREFAHIDRPALDKAVLALGECYAELQQVNADLIRAFIRQRFLQQVDLASMAASQLTEEQKKFKKVYNEGRKILENEFGKSMRYKSIRELSSRESGRVLKDIKPVWLMSPYSVSDSLPLDSDHFDVVIFDEASQITLEEGVPALYRSRQTIIVGDEKQMPPTDFFSARAEDPDDLEGLADEDEDEWLSDDVDSLLAQGARKLDSTLLSWHYRSHYETLISFSNHAFYEGRLLTIPDKTIHKTEKPAILVSNVREAGQQVSCLFDRSISCHFLESSVYEKRSNQGEAVYIAHLVRELLRREGKESIGIVAFSQEQQHMIESALSALGEEDGVFAQKLEEAYNRTENDQFTGLIVKNLENIQGDERDIIIMSVCYGPDAKGKMLMNFGPINKKGGEKRLNVLFSRARTHMAVVSSIRHGAITNEYNEGANYLKRFLQYAEMVSLGQMQGARSILDSLVLRKQEGPADSRPSLAREQIRQQLQALGYVVDEQIGQSDFKCSLAVKARPGDQAYKLGILLDDDRHYLNDNLIEQYYQRPAILERFGWKVLPVFARDWLHQPQKVMDQIVKMLEEPVKLRAASQERRAGSEEEQKELRAGQELQATSDKLQAGVGEERRTGSGEELSAGVGLGTGSYATTSPYDHLPFRRLHYREGNSDKFWEAATAGNKLVIRWGRTGSKGQIQLKTFPDVEAAQAEMEKLMQEKQGSGYVG